MARATRLPEVLGPVAGELALGDDVGLADQARPEAAGLHLMAKGRGRQPKLVGGLGEREHRSELGGGLILRPLVGDAGRFEFGVRETEPAGVFHADPERGSGQAAVHETSRDANAALGVGEPVRRVDEGLSVRRLGDEGLKVRHLGGSSVRVHAHNMADIGHVVKASYPHSTAVVDG